jgi:hypothetical protein
MIHTGFTVLTGVSVRTCALVAADEVLTRGAVLTRRGLTLVHVRLTLRPRVPVSTITPVEAVDR